MKTPLIQSFISQEEPVQRCFTIGDSWVYYKVYCGIYTTDELLLKGIKPLCEHLLDENIIDKWFFIRYSDPNPHLRLRLHLANDKNYALVLKEMREMLNPYISSFLIHDVQLATYRREIERYGANTIEMAETFFFYDSQQVIAIIERNKQDEERFISLFYWIEQMIMSFGLSLKEQAIFITEIAASFKNEFQIKKEGIKQLNEKYKKLYAQLHNEIPLFIKNRESNAVITQICELNNNNKLEIPLNSLMASFIHMSVNRTFKSDQRMFEMMLYDFMIKKTNTKLARNG